jgi:hypothetical protein
VPDEDYLVLEVTPAMAVVLGCIDKPGETGEMLPTD